jgi:hypothetical protein
MLKEGRSRKLRLAGLARIAGCLVAHDGETHRPTVAFFQRFCLKLNIRVFLPVLPTRVEDLLRGVSESCYCTRSTVVGDHRLGSVVARSGFAGDPIDRCSSAAS